MTDQSHRTDDQATMQVARQMLDVLDNFDHAFG
jgi:molecular chaperone GrpE (heat shock protein)